jgi:hypothetical protein
MDCPLPSVFLSILFFVKSRCSLIVSFCSFSHRIYPAFGQRELLYCVSNLFLALIFRSKLQGRLETLPCHLKSFLGASRLVHFIVLTVKDFAISGEARHVAVTSTSVGVRSGLLARQCQSSSVHKIWPCKCSCMLNTTSPCVCNTSRGFQ